LQGTNKKWSLKKGEWSKLGGAVSKRNEI